MGVGISGDGCMRTQIFVGADAVESLRARIDARLPETFQAGRCATIAGRRTASSITWRSRP